MEFSHENFNTTLKINLAMQEKSASKTGRLEACSRQVLMNVFLKETGKNITESLS